MANSGLKILFIFLISSFLITMTMAKPRTDLLAKTCGNTRVSDERIYMRSYAKVIQKMQKDMIKVKFAKGEHGENPNRLYLFSQCVDDLSSNDCDSCFSEISSKMISCFPYTGGRIYLEDCFMRFENYSFYEEITSQSYDLLDCNGSTGSSSSFSETAVTLIGNLVAKKLSNGYADGKMIASCKDKSLVYGMASCWKTLNKELCATCLKNAANAATTCLPHREGRSLNTGCFVRYSNAPFADHSLLFKKRVTVVRRIALIVGGIGLCSLAMILGFSLGIYLYKKRLNDQNQHNELGSGSYSYTIKTLRFKYSTLERATENFSEAHKIGQGGYGEVFKGTLQDGREIAIKRLFASGNHQIDAVCNEIDVISQAQHKNLVRLLGCCFADESILVYEFLANGSLDHVLFDSKRKKELDWKRRLGIIRGTAEGLEYLHKDYGVSIVHRDIKASNILLDWKYRPKISDFGLARFCSREEIVTNTAIAGTLGYMAPEYLVQGRLTNKVDVYGFGVLVLEIVSGIRNSSYNTDDTLNNLVTTTWKKFQEMTTTEIIDSEMEVEDVDEVLRIVQIGLLCTQELPTLRPTMSNVVQMLTENDIEIPMPLKPPYVDNCNTMSHSIELCIASRSCKHSDLDSDMR